jgi:alkylated DNA repair dioxygenase AlkB
MAGRITSRTTSEQPPLSLDALPSLPEGFIYQLDFLTLDEEQHLLAELGRIEFETFEMHGVQARRRVLHYGLLYGYSSWRLTPGPALPDFLVPLRDRVAAWMGEPPDALAEVLLTEYQPGAGIGWHRDAPGFDRIAGVSLRASCRFRFRRGRAPNVETLALTVEPRSIYLLDGPSRTIWQHSIPPTADLRYSITFRTLRKSSALPSQRSR